MKASTGLRNKLLDTNPLKSILASGFIKIYSGTAPADADTAISGGNTLLCTISVSGGGGGISFATTASNGTLAKASAEIWQGTNATSGTASFYRHVAPGDTAVTSTTESRLQGTIGLAGADMNLSSVSLSAGATQTVDYYVVAEPTL